MKFFKNIFSYLFYGHSYAAEQKHRKLNRLINQKEGEMRRYKAEHPDLFKEKNKKEYWQFMKLLAEKGKLIDEYCNLTSYRNPYATPQTQASKAIVENWIDRGIKESENEIRT